MKSAFCSILVLLICSCSEDSNLLVGTWQFDDDRTLIELKADEAAPEKLIACYERKACSYDTVYTYTNKDWTQHFTFKPKDVTGPFGYEFEKITKHHYRITTANSGEPVIYDMYFESNESAYLDAKIDGYKWKEYLMKSP